MRATELFNSPLYGLTPEPQESDEDVVKLANLLRFAGRNWRLCLAWLCASLMIGGVFAVVAPTYYTAIATILLEDRTVTPAAGGGAAMAVPDPAYVDGQVQVLASDEVVARVVDDNHLMNDDEFGGTGPGLHALESELAVMFGLKTPETESSRRYATIRRVRRALLVRRVGTSNAVEIEFTSVGANRAAALANAFARSYMDGQLELKRKAHEQLSSSLQDRLAELRDKAFLIDPPIAEPSVRSPAAEEQARARTREIQNATDTYRGLYNSFLQRRYTESIDEFFPGARVITNAEPPLRASWPQLAVVFGLAGVAGLVGGIGHGLLRQRIVRLVDDASFSTGVSLVAGAAALKSDAWRERRPRPENLQPAYAKDAAQMLDAIAKVAVRLGGQSAKNGSVVAIVAPSDRAGASTIAAHLAVIIAETGRKTLLVDANWRRQPETTLDVTADSGRKLAEVSSSIRLGRDQLDVLVLRQSAPTSELNASLSIASALQKKAADYECVVVDFHSIERTADLEASMPMIDDVVVVSEAERTSTKALQNLVGLIPRDKIAAVIVNKIGTGGGERFRKKAAEVPRFAATDGSRIPRKIDSAWPTRSKLRAGKRP